MIDKSKTYVTRSGLPAQIYRTDAGGRHPVHGAVFIDGSWSCMSWPENGDVGANYSLVEVKPKRTLDVWMNVYSDGHGALIPGGCYCSKAEADRQSTARRVSCINITREVTDGEGL